MPRGRPSYCPHCGEKRKRTSKTCGKKECREKNILSHDNKTAIICKNCGKVFEVYKSQNRKFCSHSCGAKKNGFIQRLHRAPKRKDGNHSSIVKDLEKLGVQTYDTSHIGGGFPDLLCNLRHETYLVEIKNPKTRYGKKGLNDLQESFARNWNGAPVYVISTGEDVENFANYRLDLVPHFGGGKS